ncbi:MAG: hypothetical protein JSU96_00480 [Acidobacteriota bacterium]|nr:MAG: hypothetical protein JSU96_00480 [Acidobacteriota bacterium]
MAGETVERYLAYAATPIGAADSTEEQQLSGKVINDQELGDYLFWRLELKSKSYWTEE